MSSSSRPACISPLRRPKASPGSARRIRVILAGGQGRAITLPSTAIGPVDILCRDAESGTVAVELKRRGDIDGVEQLTRYLELLNRDPHLAPVKGIFAAQEIKPQARVLAISIHSP